MPEIREQTGLPPGRSFPPERLALIGEVEMWHFWFDGRRRLATRLLGAGVVRNAGWVLDIGCGTGAFARSLRLEGYAVAGIDPEARPEAATAPSRAGVPLVRADARALPIATASCAAIVMLDVIEHTDDVAVLREVHRVLRPGGTAVITVPALPWLWSARDEQVGHLRRYGRAGLVTALEGAGFVIVEWHYYQCLLFPLMMASRIATRRRPTDRGRAEHPGSISNGLLKAVNRLEVSLGRWVRWPIGSTLAVRCRKR